MIMLCSELVDKISRIINKEHALNREESVSTPQDSCSSF